MVQTEKVKMLIAGIVLLIIPVVVFYLNFVEGMWGGTDYDWIGTLAMFMFLGLGLWAIREGLTSPPKNDPAQNLPPPPPPPPQGWQMRPKKEMLKNNIEVVKEENKESSETIHSGYFCKYCGFKNQKDAVFCSRCGKRIS